MRTSGHTVISLVLQLWRLKHKQGSISNQIPTAARCLHGGGTGSGGLSIRRLASRSGLEGQENTEKNQSSSVLLHEQVPTLGSTQSTLSVIGTTTELPANQVSIWVQVIRDRNCSKSVYDHSVVWVIMSVWSLGQPQKSTNQLQKHVQSWELDNLWAYQPTSKWTAMKLLRTSVGVEGIQRF